MTDDLEPCEFCGAMFESEIDNGWGSLYTCGTSVTFNDGTGLTWTRTDRCKTLEAVDPWELLDKAWNEMQAVLSGTMPIDAFESILEIEDALAEYKETNGYHTGND